MRYRKKSVVVEAYKTDKEIVIHTLEGDMKASIGDYIITGVNGEQYPCKPDIFEKTYEAVNNTNYDRINTMNIDKLAVYFSKFSQCDDCPARDFCDKINNRDDDSVMMSCSQRFKQWLESEVLK